MYRICLSIFIALSLILIFFTADSPAGTLVNYDITSNVTWTTAGDPYIVMTDISVKDGGSLTIEAGTWIRPYGGVSITIEDGTISMDGDSGKDEEVTFTPYNEKINWGSIIITNQATVGTMEHIIFKRGGNELYDGKYATVQIEEEGATFTDVLITGCYDDCLVVDLGSSTDTFTMDAQDNDKSIVSYGGGNGIVIEEGAVTCDECSIRDNDEVGIVVSSGSLDFDFSISWYNTGNGINAEGGDIDFTKSLVQFNGGHGLYIASGSEVTGQSLIASNNDLHGLYMNTNSTLSLSAYLTYFNKFGNNGGDGIRIATGTVTLENIDSHWNDENGLYIIDGEVTVDDSIFANNYYNGVRIDDDNGNNHYFDNVDLSNNTQNGLYMVDGQVYIDNSNMDDNGDSGLVIEDGFIGIGYELPGDSGCTFIDNGEYGIDAQSSIYIYESTIQDNPETGIYVNISSGIIRLIDSELIENGSSGKTAGSDTFNSQIFIEAWDTTASNTLNADGDDDLRSYFYSDTSATGLKYAIVMLEGDHLDLRYDQFCDYPDEDYIACIYGDETACRGTEQHSSDDDWYELCP